MRSASKYAWVFAVLLLLVAAGVILFIAVRPAQARPAGFVGGQSCAQCHPSQHEQWKGSHHALAMQVATEQTVLGNFNDVTTRFFKRDGKFYVNTEGADGKPADFQIKYTFGVEPLQQYLVEFPGGRMQALTVAWDTQHKKWYSLYAGQKIAPDDWLHWTGRAFTWNSMCAECHSTNLRRNYDPATDSYKTAWSEINVSCEACHGPGSRHMQWAQASALGRLLGGYGGAAKGLIHSFKDPTRTWGVDEQGRPKLVRSSNPDPRPQVESCAPCHSRRDLVSPEYHAEAPYLDNYVPAVLLETLYHADGQILDEVYEYGSFAQSRMYHQNVRCSDCHDPHTAKVYAPNNALCTRCHLGPRYDTPEHHRHMKLQAAALPPAPPLTPPQSGGELSRLGDGTLCVDCHMPGKHYMGIDFRRDHGLRVPRPDLSVKLGTPNACNGCHKEKDKDAKWAAQMIVQWFGPRRAQDPHWAEALHAGREGLAEAEKQLVHLAGDAQAPVIVRATAVWMLRRYGGEATTELLRKLTRDGDGLLRYAAVGGLDRLPADQRAESVGPRLKDPLRAVRIEAARVLSDVPRETLGPGYAQEFDAALTEYKSVLESTGDNRGGRLGLGNLYMGLRQLDKAERAYRDALAVDSRFVEAHVNLAQLLNQLKRNDEAEKHLRQVIQLQPQFGDAYYSLGLLIAEDGRRLPEAAGVLGKAAGLMPRHSRVHYNLGLALNSLGRSQEAEKSLLRAAELEPNNGDFVYALATFYAEQKRWAKAYEQAQKLAKLMPDNPQVIQFIEQIRRQAVLGN